MTFLGFTQEQWLIGLSAFGLGVIFTILAGFIDHVAKSRRLARLMKQARIFKTF